MVDALDLKSNGSNIPWEFDSPPQHILIYDLGFKIEDFEVG